MSAEGEAGRRGWPWSLGDPGATAGDPTWTDYVYALACGEARREPNEGYLMRAASADVRLYVGSTGDLPSRVREHELGGVKFTRVFPPVSMVLAWSAPDRGAAYDLERELTDRLWGAFPQSEVFVYSL